MADYNYPFAITHQGKAIYFASRPAVTGQYDYYYQVLELRVDSTHDQLDWAGYKPLAFPQTVSPAGMSLVDAVRAPVTGPQVRVVSDEKYVYVFRSGERQIYVSRYTMVEIPNAQVSGDKDLALEPAWQVRYQRSRSPNVPASEKDSLSYLDMDGVPFVEPVLELVLGTKDTFPLDAAQFSVRLVPTAESGVQRWQIFVVQSDTGLVYCYSLPRTPDGWFAIDERSFDSNGRFVRPDVVLDLQLDGVPLVLEGPCDSLVYLHQEPVLRSDGTQVKMQRSYRLAFTGSASATTPDGTVRGLATLDFGVGTDGVLACLAPVDSTDPSKWTRKLPVGRVEPQAFNLSFDAVADVIFKTAIGTGQTFTQELWLNSEIADTAPHLVWGGAPNTEPKAYPPSIWIVDQRRIRVGFGNGSKPLYATTAVDAFTTSAWTHVAVVFDGSSYAVYVNGVALPLTSDNFSGAAPTQSSLDHFGPGFAGELDEVRLWDRALSAADVAKYMYEELPESVITDPSQKLSGYWKLDDGSGSVARDSSTSNRDGTLEGAKWVPSTSPVAPATAAETYFDDRNLSLQAGVIMPDADTPLFGAVKPGSRPSLLNGSDGLVHLYYQGPNDEFVFAHFDVTESRAILQVPTVAGPSPGEKGVLFLATRQTGTYVNLAAGAFTAASQPPLLDLTLKARPEPGAITETWNGLPARVTDIVSILDGRAISQPDDPRLLTPGAVFYDYGGDRQIGYVPVGDAVDLGSLVWASRAVTGFEVDRVRFTPTSDAGLGDLTATITATKPGKSATFDRTMLNVPRPTPLFVPVVNGNAITTVYDYDDPDNTKAGEALIFGLPAGGEQLLVVIPDTTITDAKFKITVTTDPARCDAEITLQQAAGPLQAKWTGILRDVEGFVAAILASTTSAQKAVADHLFFREAVRRTPLDDATTDTPADLHAVASFWVALDDHAGPAVPDFDCALGEIQGATTTSPIGDAALAAGSDLVGALVPQAPVNGHPARITVPASGSVPLVLFKAAEDGGWVPEAPRACVKLAGTGAMRLAAGTPNRPKLALTGDRTVEAWVRPELVPDPSDATDPLVYPRVVHANLSNAGKTSRYLVAYQPTYYLQGTDDTQIAVDDRKPGVTDPLRLFGSNAWTLQLYIDPDLATITTEGLVCRREALDAAGNIIGDERLTIDSGGKLNFAAKPPGGQSTRVTSTAALPTGSWSAVTVVRDGTTISFYVDGVPGGGGTAPAVPAPKSRFVLGNDSSPGHFEARLSLLSIWNVALPADQVKARYRTFVADDDGGLVLMWRMDAPRTDKRIINTADATGALYNSVYAGDSFFAYPGLFYRACGAADGAAAIEADASLVPGAWNHLAMVYRSHFGAKLDGSQWATCGGEDALNVQSELSLAAWVQVQTGSSGDDRAIVSKYGAADEQQSYELGLTKTNHVYLRVRIDGETDDKSQPVTDEAQKHFLYQSATPIPAGSAAWIVATFKLQQDDKEESDPAKQTTTPLGAIYVNGLNQTLLIDSKRPMYGSLSITQSGTPVNIGRTKPNGLTGASYFVGILSDVEIYNKQRASADVASAYANRSAPPARPVKPIAAWTFREQTGTVSYDSFSNCNALFNTSEIWTVFPDSSVVELWINGRNALVRTAQAATLGGWGDEQLRFGAMSTSATAFRNRLYGQIDEIRIWNHARTAEEITDNMYRYMPGFEDGLDGYWRFDAGSGTKVADDSGWSNTVELFALPNGAMPTWVDSTAPISDEAGLVINALGGIQTDFLVKIEQTPAVVEYADAQRDHAGEVRGIMKRAYVYVGAGQLQQFTGYKVGDLVKIYVGQVQTDPTLVGYIEGPPPLPSENLTKPDYENPSAYASIASVSTTQADDFTTTLTSSRDDGSHLEFKLAIGAAVGTEAAALPFMWWEITKVEGKLGATVGVDWTIGESHSQGLETGMSTSRAFALANGGNWEAPDADGKVYLRSGERRFLPSNEGCALVKSRTADLYSFHLKSTGALVSLQLVPNTDIPEDVNLIYFPLNPEYVKNGTLDGRVGLQPDSDPYYRTSERLGSYFKPVQAYSLKTQIELQEARIVAYYQQFDAKTRGQTQQTDFADPVQRNAFIAANPAFNWETDLPRRDLVNTYVWTAAGGTYAEEQSFTSQLQESFGGSYHRSWSLGFEAEFKGIISMFGPYFTLSLNGGTDWTVTVTKSKQAKRSFGLTAAAAPERVLLKRIGSSGGQPGNYPTYYTAEPEPGKVDTYRYMTFRLAPREKNTSDFFDEVVDRRWLDLSADPRAAALRQARGGAAGSATWRILHRVTFVSRIPPRFQAVPDDSAASLVSEPVNVEANALMLELVASRLPAGGVPSPAQIGAALEQVITVDLATLVTWWADFLTAAQTPNSKEALELRSVREESLAYLREYYEAQRVEAEGFVFQYPADGPGKRTAAR
jgi:large repetitive protein